MNDVLDLVSLVETQADFSSVFCDCIDLESPIMDRILDLTSIIGDKIITIDSSVYADENARPLSFGEVRLSTKVVSSKYAIAKPPKQRF